MTLINNYKLRESNIEQKVKQYAEKRGWLVRKYLSVGQRFVPDRIFMGFGKVFFIEFKAPGKKPNAGQLLEHGEMRARGQRVYVIDSIGDGWDVVDKEGENE